MHFSNILTLHLLFVSQIVAKLLGKSVEIGLLFKQTNSKLFNPTNALRLIEFILFPKHSAQLNTNVYLKNSSHLGQI